MGKRKFEESWKDAFSDAEMGVSDSVWNAVEIGLIGKENQTNKKRVLMYQAIAASVAIFAIALASYMGFVMMNDPVGQDASVRAFNNAESDRVKSLNRSDENVESPTLGQTSMDKLRGAEKSNRITAVPFPKDDKTSSGKVPLITESIVEENVTQAHLGVDEPEHVKTYVVDQYPAPSIPVFEVKLKRTQLYATNFPRKLPAMPSFYMAEKKDKIRQNEDVWASLGFAGGSYDPGSVSGIGVQNLSSRQDAFELTSSVRPESTQASLGSAYLIGVNVGKQIFDRWVILTGIGYVRQNIEYTSNYTSVSPDNSLKVSVAEYLTSDFAPISVTSPYTISSANEFLSIPLQVGYLIVDRKIGLQANAGVSTDFFLKNTLKSKSRSAEKFSQGAGEDSPYRTINWSGLVGLEISHKLGDHYRLALVPGLRYTFNSILKEDTDLAYNPLVLDIGFRLRYIFK